MTKLLSKSYKAFIVYAAVVLTCSIPAYYFIVDLIWEYELKEHNHIVSSGIKHHLKTLQLNDWDLAESIKLWNKLQPDKLINLANGIHPDTAYNIYKTKEFVPAKDLGRFQGLITYFELNGKPYSITVETNMEESYETIIALTVVTIIFFILLMGGLVVINKRLSNKLWKPFYSTLERVKAFDIDNHHTLSFEKTEIQEFHELNSGLEKLIGANVKAYQQQKHFIENASHELQTPLAIVQSKLDVFLQESSLTQKQSGSIEQAQKALVRVNRINKNLLLLARIENGQFPEKVMVDMAETIQGNLNLLEGFETEKELNLNTELLQGVIVAGNKILLEILITNLITNAIRYTPERGTVFIELTKSFLTVSNTGVDNLNRENLFKRFGRVSINAPSTGLGLSIVQQICDQFNWKLKYTHVDGQHQFSVLFSTND